MIMSRFRQLQRCLRQSKFFFPFVLSESFIKIHLGLYFLRLLAAAAKGVPTLAQSIETKMYIQDLPQSVTDEQV